MLQDKYWDECIPQEIPYTVGAAKYKKEEFVGSAELTLSIKESDKVRIQECFICINTLSIPGVWRCV